MRNPELKDIADYVAWALEEFEPEWLAANEYVKNVDWSKEGPEVIMGVTFASGRYFQILVSEP